MSDFTARLAQALAGRYRLGDVVGRGGMAVVYRAEDLRHDRQVAIKVFTEVMGHGGGDRFLREIQLLARLHHPHILQLLDSGSAEGLLYYVMPLVEGESLRERISREPRLSPEEVVGLTIEVCDALRYAHTHGVVHRDIKPENILLVDRHAVVGDFGVARAIQQGPPSSIQTTAGLAVGTPAYMSPEQAAADPQVDHRADIYALGVVAYEMLAGRPPHTGESAHEVLAAHVTSEPKNLALLRPDLPPDLCAVVMRCLVKRPADRWPDAGALSDALQPFRLPSGSATPVPLPPFARRNRRVAIAGSAVGFLLLTALVVRLTSPPNARLEVGEPRRLGVATDLELDPTISPDGRLIAYAAGQLGSMRIRVRQIAGGEAIVIAGGVAGNQRWPRWSPDGSRVAFQALGAVYEVPALGGQPRTLIEGTPERPAAGFSWSPDGAGSVYTLDGTVYLRPAPGAEAHALVNDFVAHSPAVSPDGRWVAYVSGNQEFTFSESLLGNIAPSVLRLVPANGGTAVALTDGRSLAVSPVWLDERTLVFVGGGGATRDLFALRITRRGRAAGPPERLTTGLRAHGVGRFPGGGELVYVLLDQVSNLWAVPLPERGQSVARVRGGQPVTVGDQVVEDMDVFTVGGMLLFDSNRGGNQDIWLQTGPAGTPVQLTSDPADEFGPVWSPNGREVAYYSVREGVRHLFVMGISGLNVVQVTHDSLQDQQPQWSPDGNSLVFYRRDGAGQDRLFITSRGADSAWAEPRLLTEEPATGCAWSSDGRWIALTDPEGNLRVIDVEGGPSRIIGGPADVGGLPIRRPDWLLGEPAMLARVEAPGGTGGVWKFSLIGDPPQELVRLDDPDYPVYRTDLSTDGKQVYLVVSDIGSSVWRIAVGGPASSP
ncbi:MAG TPA: protein kinase [Gemmatimonadales bacterium]